MKLAAPRCLQEPTAHTRIHRGSIVCNSAQSAYAPVEWVIDAYELAPAACMRLTSCSTESGNVVSTSNFSLTALLASGGKERPWAVAEA
jgi:hypothetical protein